jgi:2-oxo-3-hexenedioate decarboxylase
MSMIEEAAAILDAAALNRAPVKQFAQLGLSEAYKVQDALMAHRKARGEKIVGVKMGFTSRAKMLQMGVSDLIWGRLTDGMQLEDGGSVSPQRFIHPRIEPEIAFLLQAPLSESCSPLQAGEAVAAVAPALEIIDSRYQDFQFSLSDVIADNASSSGFVVGAWRPLTEIDNLGIALSINGRTRQVGSTGAILGHPLRSLAAAARLAKGLEAGWIVLAGAGTAAEVLSPGDHAMVEMEDLGRAEIRMENAE